MTDDTPSIDFQRDPASPTLDPSFRGIRLAVTGPTDTADASQLVIRGVFQIDSDEAEAIGARPLQRALALVLAQGLLAEAWNLVGEAALFEDDEEIVDGVHRGYFNANLARYWQGLRRGTLHITVSLGRHLSNTVAMSVGDLDEEPTP